MLKNKTAIPQIKPLRSIKKDSAANILNETLFPPSTPPENSVEEKEKVDIKDLTWQDKENILRILFSKMNGISLASDAEAQVKARQELANASKHRTGFAELEPAALDQAAQAVVGNNMSAAVAPLEAPTSESLAAQRVDRWVAPANQVSAN